MLDVEGAVAELRKHGNRVIGGWQMTLSAGGPEGLCCFSATSQGGSVSFLDDVVKLLVDRDALIGPAPQPADSGTWIWLEKSS
jgi:hypothetical protein